MHVVFVTSNFPYPPTDGPRIRLFAFIKHLAARHRLTVLSFLRDHEPASAVEALRAYCADVMVVPRPSGYSVLKLTQGIWGPTAFPILNYQDPRMRALVAHVVRKTPVDVLQAEGLHMAQYCLEVPLPTVLDMHNVESMLMKRYADQEGNLLKRGYAGATWRKLAAYEREVCGQFAACLTCSEEDRRLLVEQTGVEEVHVIPNGIDLEAYKPNGNARVDRDRLVFVGRMDYRPNVDAARWFCQEILPLIQRERPDVVFQIVGGHPTKEVRRLVAPGRVEVTGHVEDVRTFLRQATAVIIPLRIGGGTRLKLLEALAMGKAVVSTTIGAEGIAAHSGEEILLADHAQGFAEQIQKVLMDADLRARLGKAARELVEVRYGWETIVGRLNQVYGECLAQPRHSSAPVGSTQL